MALSIRVFCTECWSECYTSRKANANVSASNCPDTVKFVDLAKKSCLKSTAPSSVRGTLLKSNVVTWNISPAPSASDPVMIGV